MRALVFAAVLMGLGAPALAQVPSPTWRPEDFENRQQQEQVRQQLIQQQNQLMALEAQMRAQQGMQDIQAQKQFRPVPQPAVPSGPPPSIDVGAMASIPDNVLAESNKRVLDASRNRR